MALTPYRQQIGVPREAGGGVSDIVDARVADVGGAVANVGRQMMSAAAPLLEDEAIRKAQENAGSVVLQRDEQGRLVAPERTPEGGIIYQQAFDRVMQARYLTEVGGDFQKFLDDEMAARRQGDKPLDPADYAATVESYKQGMLEGVPAWLRAETEELFTREAQERTRAFTNEVSRTRQINFINGTNDLIKFHMAALAPDALNLEAKQSGRSVDDVQAFHVQAITNLSEAMLDKGFSGDEEAQALFMSVDRLSDGVENYYSGAKLLAQNVTSIMSLDEDGLNQIELAMSGVDTIGDKGVTGTVRTSTGVAERVTPDLITATYRQLTGKDPTQVARDPNSALGKANPDSYHIAGRAVDSPRIPGMTFDEYVAWWKKQGFEVVEAKDEYKDPSAHATGGHWHVAFASSRQVIKEEAAATKVGLTFEDLNTLDTSLKQGLRQLIADRRVQIRQEEAERLAEARNQALIDAQRQEAQATRDTINGAMAAGVGGDWSSQQRGYMEREVEEVVDFGTLRNDPQQRANLLGYIQQRNYVPKRAINFLDNMIRSADWEGALQLYRGLQGATLPGGSRVGDLFLSQLDSRTAALLSQADSLVRNGQSFEQVSARLESLRSGQGFTREEAIAEFDRRNGDGKKVYAAMRDRAIYNALGVSREAALSPRLKTDVDNAFAANLDIYGDANAALEQAIKQVKGGYQSWVGFANSVGPSSLLRAYPLKTKLAPFFFNETNAATGEPLIRRVPGQTHELGRSVKLVPIDSQRDTIGRYRVLVYEPNNTRNLIDVFELDLGKELREHYGTGDRRSTAVRRADLISQARERRTAEQQSLIDFGERSNRGPKY